jgi:hypothetical protein
MVLVRDGPGKPMLALITTDLAVTAADLVARYAARWAIEVTFFDTRQILGVGQARNRTPQAVTRTWAFGMYVYTIVVLWYAVSGRRSQIVNDRRIHAPWYLSKPIRRSLTCSSPCTGPYRRSIYGLSASPTHQRGNPSGPASMGNSQPHRPRKSRGHRRTYNALKPSHSFTQASLHPVTPRQTTRYDISLLPITPAELHEDPNRLQDPDHHQQPAAGRLPSPRRAHPSATGQSGWRSLHRGMLDRNSVVRQSSADLSQFSHPQR